MKTSFKLLSLTLLASSVESLSPDGRFMHRMNSFDQQPGMPYGYGGSDMSLQNDFNGVPSFSQRGSMGNAFGGPFGRGDFGMSSFHPDMGGMRGGMGGAMGDFPPRGDFGRGSMGMGAPRGILPDEDFGLNAEMGSANRRPGYGYQGGRSMTSNHFGGRPSFHHAVAAGGGFQPDMGFGMPMNERMSGPGGMGVGGFGREEFRQMGRNGGGRMMGREEGMGGDFGREEFRNMGRDFRREEFRQSGSSAQRSGRDGGTMGRGSMNGQGMGGDFRREEFRQSGNSARRSGRPNNWN